MGGYLLSLLGVILLGVLMDIIIPSGSTSKYISGMFAIVVMFVMISPVLNFIKSDYKLSDYFTKVDIELNEKLLYTIKDNQFNTIEQDIIKQLEDGGYSNIGVDIRFNVSEDNVEITQVLVDLSNLVINQNIANINRYVYIRKVVMENVKVSEEVIVFSG